MWGGQAKVISSTIAQCVRLTEVKLNKHGTARSVKNVNQPRMRASTVARNEEIGFLSKCKADSCRLLSLASPTAVPKKWHATNYIQDATATCLKQYLCIRINCHCLIEYHIFVLSMHLNSTPGRSQYKLKTCVYCLQPISPSDQSGLLSLKSSS